MNLVLKILLIGWFILVAAILLNALIQKLGIMGWYEFLSGYAKDGSAIFSRANIVDYAWLFVLYPLLLGFSAWAGSWICERFF